MNKLLTDYKFIPFDKISTTNIEEALNERLVMAQEAFNYIINAKESSWEMIANVFYPAIYDLNQTWGVLSHLQSVADSEELRNLYEKFQPVITNFFTTSWQNEQFYTHFKNFQLKKDLDNETKRIISNELRDFKLSGVELSKEKKSEFRDAQMELNKQTTKFDQNILDSTDSYTKYCELDELTGIPEDILEQFHTAAKLDGKKAQYKITLKAPSYVPVMQYCSNRKLREELYYKYTTRASELGKKEFDNTNIIPHILELRHKKARLLGFKDYTELSLFNKMAENSKQVLDFLYELANKSKSQALSDFAELTQFAKNLDNIDKLEGWDIAYYSEKLQEQKYSYSTNELKKYFQLPIVLDGLFKLIYQLYKVEFIKNPTIPTWHKDVETYDLVKDNLVIGHIYCDLYARSGKQSGAWMNSAQDRYIEEDIIKNPIAYIICNFASPLDGKNSLLTFDDVQTLFHEMGHALHHLLTKVNHYSISGINNVEWDAVELPSQFMEYFTWNYLILSTISKHEKSGSILPLELYNKLLNSRFFQSGLQMLRQLEFAIFDIMIHDQSNTNLDEYLKILNNVRRDVAVIIPPEYNRFPHSFSHIFSGGYAAGYYSYKWAEVLATDIFSRFDEVKMDKYEELGNKFLGTILSQGGLNPMLKNFTDFMGRKPEINALLKYSGIIETIK